MMRRLNRPAVIFAGYTVTSALLLSANYTPTRAVVWGSAWAATGAAFLFIELRGRHNRPDA